jgi:hypothetical protein
MWMTDDMDYDYVHGDDLAPNGKSWRIVFNETLPISGINTRQTAVKEDGEAAIRLHEKGDKRSVL